jgi:transcriptional regulator with XRE-family HTH domain
MKTDFTIADKESPIAEAIEDKKNRQKKIEGDRLARIQEFYDRCIYHRYGDENNHYLNNYKTGTTCGNIVGDRIKFILEKEDITIKDLAERSGVGRSSLHRFLDSESPDIPKVATLDKIISKLPCFADDFLYSPDNYKKWESAYSGYRLNFGKSFCDYEKLRDYVIFQLSLPVAYNDENKKYKMPAQVLDILSNQIFSAFETADALLEYEKDKKKPKGYFEEPVEIADIDL